MAAMTLEQMLEQPALRVLDGIPLPLSLLDPDSRVIYANPAFCRTFSVAPERLLGRGLVEAVPPAERSRVQDCWSDWLRGETRMLRLHLPGSNGEVRPFLLVPGPVSTASGNRLGVVVSCVPALAAASVEAAVLRGALGRVRAALERALAHTRSLDAPGAIQGFPGGVKLTGRERDVVARLARGDRVAHISAELGIRPVTVRNHLKAIFRKLGVHSQRELVAKLREAPLSTA